MGVYVTSPQLGFFWASLNTNITLMLLHFHYWGKSQLHRTPFRVGESAKKPVQGFPPDSVSFSLIIWLALIILT